MQRRMLPITPTQFAGFTLRYELYGAGELSGDFIDFVALPGNHVAFLIADVAGHGASAALVTVALKSFVSRVPAQTKPTPGSLLSQLNTELLAIDLDRHVCALVGVIDLEASCLSLASAGFFPQPFLSAANADSSAASGLNNPPRTTSLEIAGKALGLFEADNYPEQLLSFAIGDRLTVVTDGILEWLTESSLDEKEQRLAKATAAPLTEFWSTLGVVPSAGGVDDVSWFTLERHA